MCNSDVNTCPHFGICGGCQLFDMSYEEQLRFKSEKVHTLLAPYLGDAVFEEPVASPDIFGYRNKMEFTFGDVIKDGPLTLGLHQKKSFYNVVTVDNCRIVDEDYRRILCGILDYFSQRGIKYYHKKRGTGHLRHLVIRKAAATGEILVMIVSVSSLTIETGFTDMLLALPLSGRIAGVLHAKNDLPADMVQAQELVTLYGRDYFYEDLLGLRFKITPFSFFQTNSRGAERLYEVVREYCGNIDGQKIFDLYSGTGTIAQVLAPAVSHVTGVEIVEEAVAAARENAAANGLTNCTFIAGDVFKVLSELPELPEFIVLDPPREGMTPKALSKIISYGVERIVYVSCKPDSLARDLAIFTEQGYKVEKTRCVDMFPWTRHIETVALLSRTENRGETWRLQSDELKRYEL